VAPPTYLDEIVAAHRGAAAADTRDLDTLLRTATEAPPTRGFRRALLDDDRLAVIAEVKRRSPSKGDLDPGLDPAEVGRQYEAGGAACLSVLTDAAYFGGSATDLQAARAAVELPVLRKDFTVCAADLCDARIMGADAVLLIVAALDDAELAGLRSLGSTMGLDVLVEVHDADELERALAAGSNLIGVNQRDLRTFDVDPERALALVAEFPADVVAVAESGIGGPEDAGVLAAAGFDAVLVGESLVRASDRRAAVAAMSALPKGARPSGRTSARTGR